MLDLIPKLTEPKAKLTVALNHDHPLTAKTRCNLHGLWQSFPIPLEVED